MQKYDNFGYLLNHLAFVLSRQSDQVLLERMGLGFSQFKILQIVKRKPYMQQKQIAEMLGQTEASISRQVKLLQSQGILQTTRRPENKREHITTLTPKGERFADEAIEVLKTYHAPVFDSLNDKQKANLREALKAMHTVSCGSTIPEACRHAFDAN